MLTTKVSAASPEEVETPAPAEPERRHELDIAAEIAHAFLRATHPLEVYRVALARVTQIVGARFSSVYLRDPDDPSLLRLHCAFNWPQNSARFLGQLRIGESRGPAGIAAANNLTVEVTDVFADPSLEEWWEPARELGFVSTVSLPLQSDRIADDSGSAAEPNDRLVRDTFGAVSFYFDTRRELDDGERRLLALVADQLAAVAAKAQLIEELHRANDQLRATNEDLRRRVEEFEAARRLKDEFLANITHEFRTPLTSILGYGYLLSSEQLGTVSEKQQQALERMEVAGKTLLRLITDLIDLAQLKLGQIRATAHREDAVMLARRALDDAGPPPPEVTTAIHADEAGVILMTDGEKVIRILANLVRNAYKFTTKGAVTIHVVRRRHADSASVIWTVRDTGIGIRPEDLDVIFDDFRQADGSSTRVHGGLGLGLALARRLAEVVGGEISAESVPGEGAEFRFVLPV